MIETVNARFSGFFNVRGFYFDCQFFGLRPIHMGWRNAEQPWLANWEPSSIPACATISPCDQKKQLLRTIVKNFGGGEIEGGKERKKERKKKRKGKKKRRKKKKERKKKKTLFVGTTFRIFFVGTTVRFCCLPIFV